MSAPPPVRTAASRAASIREFVLARPLVSGSAAVLAACALLIVFADAGFARAVHAHLPREVRDFFNEVTWFGKAGKYVLLFGLGYLGLRAAFLRAVPGAFARIYHDAARICLFVLVSLALSGVVVNVLKPLLGRLRPKHLWRDDLYGFGFSFSRSDLTANSFPSGHSQTLFAIATALALLFPRLRWPLLAFAALVALSRVMVSAHFVSDVLLGSYIGLVAAVAARRIWFADLTPPRLPPLRAARRAGEGSRP